MSDNKIQVQDDGLLFNVPVDGKLVSTRVPALTLQHVFGAAPHDGRSWVGAYRQHAARINHVAIRKGRRLRSASITLDDEDFAPA